MVQEAVPPHPGYMSVDGRWIYLQVPGNLSIGHSTDRFHEDLLVDVGTFLPVGCAEGLSAEGDAAILACKPLYTPVVDLS